MADSEWDFSLNYTCVSGYKKDFNWFLNWTDFKTLVEYDSYTHIYKFSPIFACFKRYQQFSVNSISLPPVSLIWSHFVLSTYSVSSNPLSCCRKVDVIINILYAKCDWSTGAEKVEALALERRTGGGQAVTEKLLCYFVQQHGELTLRGMGKIDRGVER